MIYTSGLSSTLAMLKGGKNSVKVYNHIEEWIWQNPVIGFSLNQNEYLIQKVLEINDPMVLNALTKELLSLTDALKEMVKAEFKL
jgi:hypothetical protein